MLFGTASRRRGCRTSVSSASAPGCRKRGRVQSCRPVRKEAVLMAASTSPISAITRKRARWCTRRSRAPKYIAVRIQKECQVQVLVKNTHDVRHHDGQRARTHRKHQGIAADPPRDCLETTEGRCVSLNGADERPDIVATEKPKRLGGCNQRRDLPKGGCKRPDTAISDVTDSDVDDKHADQCRSDSWPDHCQNKQQDRRGSENWKQHVPRPRFDGISTGQPPEIVSVRISQTGQCRLRSFSQPYVGFKSADQYLKHFQVVGYWNRPQAMIERVLSDRALRSVESREHGVEVQIVPSTSIQRGPGSHIRQTGAVGLGDCLHLSLATNRLAPSDTDLCESPCSTAACHQSSETQEGAESDEHNWRHTRRSL